MASFDLRLVQWLLLGLSSSYLGLSHAQYGPQGAGDPFGQGSDPFAFVNAMLNPSPGGGDPGMPPTVGQLQDIPGTQFPGPLDGGQGSFQPNPPGGSQYQQAPPPGSQYQQAPPPGSQVGQLPPRTPTGSQLQEGVPPGSQLGQLPPRTPSGGQPQQGVQYPGGQYPQMTPGGSQGQFPGGSPQQNGGSPRFPNPQDIMDNIAKKFRDLFPIGGFPGPLPDPSTLFPLPDMSNVSSKVPKNGFFYSFSPLHREAMREIRQVLQAGNSTDQILDIAKSLQANQNVHPHLWFYALSSVACKNAELSSINSISPVDALPDMFIHAETLSRARGEGQQRQKRQGQPACVVADENVGADNGPENRLWYFRESIGVNAHHWYYHTMYPFGGRTKGDRHGELFYYMHASVVARYNAERLSNGLPRVQAVNPIRRGTTLEGYNPHLRDDNSGATWSARPANLPISDINHQNDPNLRENLQFDTLVLQSINRVLQSINDGFLVDTSNRRVPINTVRGIDLLGDLILADQWSINPNYYGSNSGSGFHNNGHLHIAFIADPQYRSRLPPGVMADSAPAMRDTVFYRWHEVLNQLFEAHKTRLTPYAQTGGELPLVWPGVRVTTLSVTPAQSGTVNRLTTFWGTANIRLSRGLDLGTARQPIQICAKQLDHEEFTFEIGINNGNTAAVASTVRIFLAPRFDEAGNRFNMTEQRRFFFVLDTFSVRLNPGANTVRRNSVDSTLTIPWAQSLQELNGDPQLQTPNCGCGWPRNMLLPKGTPAGMTYDLFVMVTNGNEDAVAGPTTRQTCRAAPLYCGIANQLYPDARPMGYPFDRLPYTVNQRVVATLDEYVSGVPNMGTIQVQIRFTGQ